MNLDALITSVQRELGITVDGKAGPQTWNAIHDRIVGEKWPSNTITPSAAAARVDARSEENIATLHPRVQPYARSLVLAAAQQGINVVVTSGLRTYEEQNELYKQGRSKPGEKVTNARGGYSNHNFGIAFDVTIFNGSKPVWESPAYKAVGSLGVSLGLEWGGNWKSTVDEPHFQLRPAWAKDMAESAMLAELRERTASGKDLYA